MPSRAKARTRTPDDELNRRAARAAYWAAAARVSLAAQRIASEKRNPITLPNGERAELIRNAAAVVAVEMITASNAGTEIDASYDRRVARALARERRAVETVRRLYPTISLPEPDSRKWIRARLHVRARAIVERFTSGLSKTDRQRLIGTILFAGAGMQGSVDAVRHHYEAIPAKLKEYGFPEADQLRILAWLGLLPPGRRVLPFPPSTKHGR